MHTTSGGWTPRCGSKQKSALCASPCARSRRSACSLRMGGCSWRPGGRRWRWLTCGRATPPTTTHPRWSGRAGRRWRGGARSSARPSPTTSQARRKCSRTSRARECSRNLSLIPYLPPKSAKALPACGASTARGRVTSSQWPSRTPTHLSSSRRGRGEATTCTGRSWWRGCSRGRGWVPSSSCSASARPRRAACSCAGGK
mmetsp:Transcript_70848/g.224288  ORF Transcript_70848/g.224288 Transcript_70848/m.224288 type:complete len:200 (-) Transcript_70848:172-771(-)